MAKRFIDTDVFKKQFMRELKPAYKLLWIYITTDCNHAGIWECDFDVAQIRTGQKIDQETAKKVFKDKIVELDGGAKWFIPSFIEFQYGDLSEKNRAHHSVISILSKYNLLDAEGSYKPLISSLQGAMDMDMDKEQDNDKDKDKEGAKKKIDEAGVVPMLSHPFSINFDFAWEQWRKFKKDQFRFVYKTIGSEQIAINELVKMSGENEKNAVEIIMASISNGWKGLFPLKDKNKNGTHQQSLASIKQANNISFIERTFAKHSGIDGSGRTKDSAA